MAHCGRFGNMNLKTRVALNKKEERHRLGISQEKLAYRAGVSRTYLGRLENSKYSATLDFLEKIANGLKTDPSKLTAPQ